jgi:signal transduction histidine kinase
MPSIASQISTRANHPWSETLRAFSHLDLGAVVLRVDYAKELEETMKSPLPAVAGDDSRLAISGRCRSVIGGCVVVESDDKTRAMLQGTTVNAIATGGGALEFEDVTQLLTQRIMSMAPVDWTDIVRAIYRGEGQFFIKSGSDLTPIRAVVHGRLLAADGLYSLISLQMQKDVEKGYSAAESKTAGSEVNRLAMVGKLSSHILHEINNPVTVISGKAEKIQSLVESLPISEGRQKIHDTMIKIIEMTERIHKIIRSMKNLTRANESEPCLETKVSDLVNEVYDLVDLIAKKNRVVLRRPRIDADFEIPMRRLRLSQLMVNLMSNSIDAIATGDERWVEVKASKDDRWAYIHVTDSGHGVPEHFRSRLFETFFSTKGAGQGTGIGLSLSRDIAREHGGDIYLDESSGRTCFVVKLPLVQPKSPRNVNLDV